jgi:hypothetical protein
VDFARLLRRASASARIVYQYLEGIGRPLNADIRTGEGFQVDVLRKLGSHTVGDSPAQ